MKSIYKIRFFVIWKHTKHEKHIQNHVFCDLEAESAGKHIQHKVFCDLEAEKARTAYTK